MPDVTRSDSQRSDASLRPRVSFNRDVHVKRIVPREGPRVATVERENHASTVRKEKLPRSKEALIKEASEVLHRADRVGCVVQNSNPHQKYNTLPARRKHPDFNPSSLDRRSKRRNSEEILIPPKKPPRTFASTRSKSPQRNSIFNLFKKAETSTPKKSNLRRSVSDASALKPSQDDVSSSRNNLKSAPKKQLSPIIEITPREDYFQASKNEEENVGKPKSITEQLQEYIDEVDEDLFRETGIRISPDKDNKDNKSKAPRSVVIDVDEADQISKKKPTKKVLNKLKSLTKRGDKKKKKKEEEKKTKEIVISRSVSVKANQKSPSLTKTPSSKSLEDLSVEFKEIPSISPTIKRTIEDLELKFKGEKDDMIHSSQKPVDKLPLTRGRTVDNMVKRLSRKSTSPPPPKTNVIFTPTVSVQHNNNQPFSYTRGLSPDKIDSPKPIIYAQVVCNNKSPPNKQTIHTYVNGKKNIPHSDSDEGLGYEENLTGGFQKSTTRFGDHQQVYKNHKSNDYYIEEEFITPKFKNVGYNGFGSYEDSFEDKFKSTEQNYFTERGRGDGMDSKRRESLTEHEEVSKFNDLSARRDILESRINRRFRISPDYSPKNNSNINNVYISESNTKYVRSGSESPIGYKENYISETTINNKGQSHHNRRYFGNERISYKDYFDHEPKSFDSQISDYRSSPENNRYFETSQNQSIQNQNYRSTHKDKYTKTNQQIRKDRNIYKSNPEIHHRSYDNYKYDDRYQETYHDSLKREKHENKISSKYRNERYFDQNDNERKDKFGDSGIENDFRRDSGDNFKLPRSEKKRELSNNESEDEGFASSLLIASERQHTEDNFNRRRREYEKTLVRENKDKDDHFRNLEAVDYKYKKYEYSPRERSIDDGSHYDPRLDKDFDRGTLKKVDKKPPKPEKKSSLEKVKQLFSRDSKKKKEKEKNMVTEETLRSRYTEYRGSREELEPKSKRKEESSTNYTNYANRRRLSTPSPTREVIPPPRVEKQRQETSNGGWFKSLDRLSRKKPKKIDKDSSSDETPPLPKQTPTKNLRFFGDTDAESASDSLRKRPPRARATLASSSRSQSTRDLHNISEETSPEARRRSHKSLLNVADLGEPSAAPTKPPASPGRRDASRARRRKNEVSSVESSTEGDSSQQSQRSVVYLHAPTVGDIPGPGYLRNGRRAASREELASNSSSRIQPQTKTLSRSFSVLAPWRPKHYKESMDIDYTQYPKPESRTKNGKYEQRVTKNSSSRKETSSTLKKKAQETKRSNQNNTSTLNRRSRSKENVSSSTLKRGKDDVPRGSNSTLYKKRERPMRENARYSSNRDERKMSSKSMSVESLGGGSKSSRKSREEVSRSISMPRDPEKSAGWFNMKKKKSGSSQRL